MKKLKLDLSNLTSKELLSKVELKKIIGGYESKCGLDVRDGTFYSDADGCGTDYVAFVDQYGNCMVAYNDPTDQQPCGWA